MKHSQQSAGVTLYLSQWLSVPNAVLIFTRNEKKCPPYKMPQQRLWFNPILFPSLSVALINFDLTESEGASLKWINYQRVLAK